MRTIGRYLTHGLLLAGLAAFVGCSGGQSPTTGGKDKKPAGGHPHPTEGPHEGALVEWGEEEYHPEFTVDHGKKQATVYILDGEAKDPAPIEAETITLTLTNVDPVVTIDLKADPQMGDPMGKSSRFTGTHEALGKEQPFKGLIAGKIGGTAYSGPLDETEAHKDD